MSNSERPQLQKIITSGIIIKSLMFERTQGEAAKFRSVGYSHKTNEIQLPLNTEEDILAGFLTILERRNIVNRGFDYQKPYWLETGKYDLIDVFNSTIHFFDDHKEPIPSEQLPPSCDVELYGSTVMKSKQKLTVVDQMSCLLDITNNNIVGAANLAFITSRFYGRGTDRRAYPQIDLNYEDMRAWQKNIAHFEVYDKDALMHGVSDTYYFWTHFFASLIFSLYSNWEGKVPNYLFANGTDIMVRMRKLIAKSQTFTQHREASLLGREIGLAIKEFI